MLILHRTYALLSGLQTFAPASASVADTFVPLEVLIDFRCESDLFERLVPQTDATLHYDKFNRLRLRSNLASTVARSSSDSGPMNENHLSDQTVRSFFEAMEISSDVSLCYIGSDANRHSKVHGDCQFDSLSDHFQDSHQTSALFQSLSQDTARPTRKSRLPIRLHRFECHGRCYCADANSVAVGTPHGTTSHARCPGLKRVQQEGDSELARSYIPIC